MSQYIGVLYFFLLQPATPVPVWRSQYPFESNFVTLDGQQYHYLDEGEGAPLLLVHGNPTWSFYWRNLITAWRNHHRAIAPDHIGCGLSDKPRRYAYTFEQHSKNLMQFVQHLDLAEITLVAHDWGGAIGLNAAVQMPERFSRIVLFNTGAFPPPYVPWRLRACRVPGFGQVAIQGFNLFARAAIHMATAKPERMTADVRGGLLAPYDSWAHRQANYQFVRDIPTHSGHPTWRALANVEQGLSTLSDRPTQMIWGMRDWCFNQQCLERLVESFPNAEVHRLDDAGHYVVEDAYERIIPLVERFLEQNPVAADSSACADEA